MKVFSKLKHYHYGTTNGPGSRSQAHRDYPQTSSRFREEIYGPPIASSSDYPKAFVWVSTSPIQPKSACSSALQSCWRLFYRLAQPTLRSVGQCMFGLAMLFILAGIALSIWGYVGIPIPPFQIFGPVCIGVGLLIYIIGCVLCCREYPAFERTLKEKARQEKIARTIKFLAEKDVIEGIQNDPETYEDFKVVAHRILVQPGLNSNSGNIIANMYTTNACPESGVG